VHQSDVEYALAEMIPKYPHLVKLGVRLEFRQGDPSLLFIPTLLSAVEDL
jgi:hypothetical protein